METTSTILVFKTDINTEARRELVGEFFKSKGIAWNVDLQDVDSIVIIITLCNQQLMGLKNSAHTKN